MEPPVHRLSGTSPTVRFAFDGTDYEIDLNAKNAAAFGRVTRVGMSTPGHCLCSQGCTYHVRQPLPSADSARQGIESITRMAHRGWVAPSSTAIWPAGKPYSDSSVIIASGTRRHEPAVAGFAAGLLANTRTGHILITDFAGGWMREATSIQPRRG